MSKDDTEVSGRQGLENNNLLGTAGNSYFHKLPICMRVDQEVCKQHPMDALDISHVNLC